MEPNNNRFYVYVYLDPRKPGDYNYGDYHFDYEPFYVGKGHNTRSECHLSGNNYNKHFDNTIKKIQNVCNTDPIIIKHQEMLLEQDSFNLEIKLIATIGRSDLKIGPLCNKTNGGEGISGLIFSKEHKWKIGCGTRGKVKGPLPQDTKDKLSILLSGENNPMYGKSRPDMSLWNKNNPKTGSKNGRAHPWKITNINTGVVEIIDCLQTYCNDNMFNYRTIKSAYNNSRPYRGLVFTSFSQTENAGVQDKCVPYS